MIEMTKAVDTRQGINGSACRTVLRLYSLVFAALLHRFCRFYRAVHAVLSCNFHSLVALFYHIDAVVQALDSIAHVGAVDAVHAGVGSSRGSNR